VRPPLPDPATAAAAAAAEAVAEAAAAAAVAEAAAAAEVAAAAEIAAAALGDAILRDGVHRAPLPEVRARRQRLANFRWKCADLSLGGVAVFILAVLLQAAARRVRRPRVAAARAAEEPRPRSSSFGIAVYLGPPCDFGSASASSRLHDLQRATGFAATTCFQKGPCFGQTNWRRSIVVSADAVALSWRSWCVRLSVVSAAGATPAAATAA